MTRREAFGALAVAPLAIGAGKKVKNLQAALRFEGVENGFKCYTAYGFIVTFADGSTEEVNCELPGGEERMHQLVPSMYAPKESLDLSTFLESN